MTTIDVVVVNYRTKDDLSRFLDSVLQSEGLEDVRVTICDVDPLPDDRRFSFDWISKNLRATSFFFSENVGYARAVNAGAEGGRGQVIAIFNADVVLTPTTLKNCATALMSEDSWGVLGPLQQDLRGNCTHSGIFGTRAKPTWREGWQQKVHNGLRDVRDDAVTVMGSCYFIKRSLWDELRACPIYNEWHEQEFGKMPNGAFLPTSHYFEETWASYHAIEHGKKVVYYGLEEPIHTWNGSVKANDKLQWAAQQFDVSQKMFRSACQFHSIPHD